MSAARCGAPSRSRTRPTRSRPLVPAARCSRSSSGVGRAARSGLTSTTRTRCAASRLARMRRGAYSRAMWSSASTGFRWRRLARRAHPALGAPVHLHRLPPAARRRRPRALLRGHPLDAQARGARCRWRLVHVAAGARAHVRVDDGAAGRQGDRPRASGRARQERCRRRRRRRVACARARAPVCGVRPRRRRVRA